MENDIDASGASAIALDTESRWRWRRWVRTGGRPFGARVALTEGRSENPDSSWKMIHAPGRRAFS